MVAGRNGSGKTTLLRVLSTAIRADQGSGRVEGFALTERELVRKNIAFLGHASNTYDALTAFQNLQVSASFLGAGGERDRLLSILETVSLAERADDAIHTFSAGMRKRLAIARVLLQIDVPEGAGARVVFLDEPFGQLDPPGFRLVESLFETLRSRGLTVLLSTHQLERGAALCDRGIVLQGGRLKWSGPAADLPRQGGVDPAVLG